MRIERVLAMGSVTAFAFIAGLAAAGAQSGNRPDPADPGVAVPAMGYESAFPDYQPFREQKGNAWKQVNKEVADNPGMASMQMKEMPGKTEPGMDSEAADAPKEGHDMKQMEK